MLVGKPVGAVVEEPSEARVLLGSPASVGLGGGAVVVGAKVSWVGTSTVVASLVPVGIMLWGAWLVVVAGVVMAVDSDSDAMGTGTTAVVESDDDGAGLSVDEVLSVPLVTTDSAVPDVVGDAEVSDAEVSETPVEDAESGVVEASEAPEVAVDTSEAPVVAVDASGSPDVVVASGLVEVAVTLPVARDSAPDVASPDPVVSVAVSSAGVEIGTGTTGTIVLLVSVATSVELLEEAEDGLSVG
jgi:hypothetical protein